jgi:16S rRNA (guanine527-N7)-methyltransferase
MDLQRMGDLLQPFLRNNVSSVSVSDTGFAIPTALSKEQLQQLSTYHDLLLHWNARINLTAVRAPEEIVTRHFGESLFAARHLFPSGQTQTPKNLIDFGSGAGFPGLPIKISVPDIELILVESNQKKATFLREVIRRLNLPGAAVFSERAENLDIRADTVTLRAVERFEKSLPVAAHLVALNGRLALLIGDAQIKSATGLITEFKWGKPIRIPGSENRALLVGTAPA